MIHETGFGPGRELEAAARVSTGAGDPGGVSYGAYQFNSTHATGRVVMTFLRTDGSRWAAEFRGEPNTRNGEFGRIWQAIARRDGMAFFVAQHAFIERTHYGPVVDYVRQHAAFNVVTRSRAVQNVVWSMSVQHGRAKNLVVQGIRALDANQFSTEREFDRALINKLYDIRSDYVVRLGLPNLRNRYRVERRDALRQLGD